MTTRRSPSFRSPPVVEVALSVQLQAPLPLRVVDFGELWSLFRGTFPTYEEQDPLAPVVDRALQSDAPTPSEAVDAVILPRAPFRLWFSNPAGYLVQVQADRFIFNWRRSSDAAYPRFERICAEFQTAFKAFTSFVASCGIEPPEVELCEVTYVNHIPSDGGSRTSNVDRIFSGLKTPSLSDPTAEPHTAECRLSFTTAGSDGKRGRLAILIQPAFRRNDKTEVVVINVIGRRRPASSGFDHVLAALRDGHNWIVHAFKDVTRPEMHQQWGLEA